MDYLEQKRKNLDFGGFAEDKATEYYISKGYAILERNWHLGKIEIDLIAQREDVVVFVEVKARSGRDMDAVSAVTYDKMKRMAKGAHAYLRYMKGDLEYRFDIFALTGDCNEYETEVVEDAFLAPLF